MAIREPFEPPSVADWALIIHADSTGERVDVYWVDINAGRIGLRLADEVKAWRRREDLLTIGHRLRIAIPHPETEESLRELGEPTVEPPPPLPAIEPERPGLAPVSPVEASRTASRREYLAGRVRAILGHSETAKQALARAWPDGVPGLKHEGQSWEQLDLILDAVQLVEKNHSVPFYPEWDDPFIEQSKREHPSNVWAKPEGKSTPEEKDDISREIMRHPRSALMRRWIMFAINGGVDSSIDTTALAHALYEFGSLDATEWPDDELTVMLDGSLRALGYGNGCEDLGHFNPEHAPFLMSAAFAITAGNAHLLFDDDGKPIVRTNVRKS